MVSLGQQAGLWPHTDGEHSDSVSTLDFISWTGIEKSQAGESYHWAISEEFNSVDT